MNTPRTYLRRIAYALADTILPSSCLCCGIANAHTDMHGLCLCEHCAQSYQRASRSFTRLRCPLCRRHTGVAGQVCERCTSHPPGYDRLYSLGPYSGIHARLMQAYKKEGSATLAGLWAHELSRMLLDTETIYQDMPSRVLAIQPVPPRPNWRRGRQFDPVGLLAGRISSLTGTPVVQLLRRKDPYQQKHLGRTARLDHARQSYAHSSEAFRPEPTHRATHRRLFRGTPAHVLLIDDVRTTGATLDACTELLRQAGCRSVTALVVLTHET